MAKLYFKSKGDKVYNTDVDGLTNRVFGFNRVHKNLGWVSDTVDLVTGEANDIDMVYIEQTDWYTYNYDDLCTIRNKSLYPKLVITCGYGSTRDKYYYDIEWYWKPFILAPLTTVKFRSPWASTGYGYISEGAFLDCIVMMVPLTVPITYSSSSAVSTALSGPGTDYLIDDEILNAITIDAMPVVLTNNINLYDKLFAKYQDSYGMVRNGTWNAIPESLNGLSHSYSQYIQWSSCPEDNTWWYNKLLSCKCAFPFVFGSGNWLSMVRYYAWSEQDPNYLNHDWGLRFIQMRLPLNATSSPVAAHDVGYIRYNNSGYVTSEQAFPNTDGSESFQYYITLMVPVAKVPYNSVERIIAQAYICSEIGTYN